MTSHEDAKFLARVCFPYATKRIDEIRENNTRFVHYTSAASAMSILQNRQIWMRQPACMNDSQEITYGVRCISKALQQNQFKKTLEEIYDGLSTEIETSIDGLLSLCWRDAYLVSISEHEAKEDSYGRLSMWRAYGKSTGVAIVLNHHPVLGESNLLKSYSMPVLYADDTIFQQEMAAIVANIRQEIGRLRSFDKTTVRGAILNVLRFAALATKHAGFAEEREWRVIYTPNIERSSYMEHSISEIYGVPQEIYKLPLRSIKTENFYGLEPNDLIDRIIIGPTEFPLVLEKAFVKLLKHAQVDAASSKVIVSDIPLRK